MCNIYRWWDQILYSSCVNWLTNFNSNKSTYCDSSPVRKSSSCQQSYSWCLRECTFYWVIWLWVLSLALICFMLYNLAFHFRGKCSFFLPFVYYKFLSLRYTSRRNPYCRFVKIYFNACVPACLICYNTLKIYALH